MIAAVAYLFVIIGSLFVTEANFAERLMMGLMPAGMAFIAALILFSRDRARFTATMRSVRRKLLDRQDVNDAEFLSHFPQADSTLILQTRRAVSEFFNVPVQKIHPTDHLRNDLKIDTFEPDFHPFIVFHVCVARQVEPRPYAFSTGDLVDIDDLANEIESVLDIFSHDDGGKARIE